MNQHTPGPWKIDLGHQTKQARGISAPSRNIVNFNGLAAPASEESAANAKLIAAAPDLLSALAEIVDTLDAIGGNEHARLTRIGRAALSKAAA